MWIQDKGGIKPRLRGHIVIEDLRPVLSTIATRQGANGPQNPVTQYMLAEASNYLADRLLDDGRIDDEVGPHDPPHIVGRAGTPTVRGERLGDEPTSDAAGAGHGLPTGTPTSSTTSCVPRASPAPPPRSLPNSSSWGKGPLGGVVRFLIDEANRPRRPRAPFGWRRPRRRCGRTTRLFARRRTPIVARSWNCMCRPSEGLMVTYGLRPHPGVNVAAISWVLQRLVLAQHSRTVGGSKPRPGGHARDAVDARGPRLPAPHCRLMRRTRRAAPVPARLREPSPHRATRPERRLTQRSRQARRTPHR